MGHNRVKLETSVNSINIYVQFAYNNGKVHPAMLPVVVTFSIAQAKDVLFNSRFISKVRKNVELFLMVEVFCCGLSEMLEQIAN